MPCEGCQVKFTVFRRKRICTDCRRYYCSDCLTGRSTNVLCERCAIFAKRPLLRIDLLQLKARDLIFYLQSKHVSTTGCIEKEDLVGLVLTHVNQNDAPNIGSSNGSKFSEQSDSDKPFGNIKQTCQNFFHTITDKIASDFNFSDMNTSAATSTNNAAAGGAGAGASAAGLSVHISDQPRISTREIPTYSSFQNQPPPPPPPPPPTPPPAPASSSSQHKSNTSTPASPISSPVVSISSISFQSAGSSSPHPITADGQSTTRPTASYLSAHSSARNRLLDTVLNDEENASECECSDDEIIATFKQDRSNRDAGGTSMSPTTSSPSDNQMAGPSSSGNANVTVQNKSSPSLQIGSCENSSESSFEELGALGLGTTSDDNKTDSNDNKTDPNVQNDSWYFVNKANNATTVEEKKEPTPVEGASGTSSGGTATDLILVVLDASTGPNRAENTFPQRPKRLTRRRSDGYLNRRRYVGEQVLPFAGRELSVEEEDDDDEDDGEVERCPSWNRKSKCCGKCGKNKSNIKTQAIKLRRHLENANMSKEDIKRELEQFVVYVQNRMGILDCGELVYEDSATSPYLDEDEGIHVYANRDGGYDPRAAASRFLNLNDFESLEELENLTVKQLKQVLTLNRVDYKGCCEKQELLERVKRLWKTLKCYPVIEKLPRDELCKICMDAPIECVILECGHMATCTNCGKVLSECPICRQYIVRVVRFFRA